LYQERPCSLIRMRGQAGGARVSRGARAACGTGPVGGADADLTTRSGDAGTMAGAAVVSGAAWNGAVAKGSPAVVADAVLAVGVRVARAVAGAVAQGSARGNVAVVALPFGVAHIAVGTVPVRGTLGANVLTKARADTVVAARVRGGTAGAVVRRRAVAELVVHWVSIAGTSTASAKGTASRDTAVRAGPDTVAHANLGGTSNNAGAVTVAVAESSAGWDFASGASPSLSTLALAGTSTIHSAGAVTVATVVSSASRGSAVGTRPLSTARAGLNTTAISRAVSVTVAAVQRRAGRDRAVGASPRGGAHARLNVIGISNAGSVGTASALGNAVRGGATGSRPVSSAAKAERACEVGLARIAVALGSADAGAGGSTRVCVGAVDTVVRQDAGLVALRAHETGVALVADVGSVALVGAAVGNLVAHVASLAVESVTVRGAGGVAVRGRHVHTAALAAEALLARNGALGIR